jgi:hypothetical protein
MTGCIETGNKISEKIGKDLDNQAIGLAGSFYARGE